MNDCGGIQIFQLRLEANINAMAYNPSLSVVDVKIISSML